MNQQPNTTRLKKEFPAFKTRRSAQSNQKKESKSYDGQDSSHAIKT